MEDSYFNAFELARRGKYEDLKILVENHPYVASQKDKDKMLLLHWVWQSSNVPYNVISCLVKAYPKGCETKNKHGFIPLHLCLRTGCNLECIKALLQKNMNSILIPFPNGELPCVFAKNNGIGSESLVYLKRMESKAIHEQIREKSKQLKQKTSSFSNADFNSFSSSSSSSSSSFSSFSSSSSSNVSLKLRDTCDSTSTCTTNTNSSFGFPMEINDPNNDKKMISSSTSLSFGKPLPIHTSTVLNSKQIMTNLPPRWSNASICHICICKFNPFRKRHHCRNCGQSICSSHRSNIKLPLSHYGLEKKQSVCILCFEELMNASKEEIYPKNIEQIYQEMNYLFNDNNIEKIKQPKKIQLKEKKKMLQQDINRFIASSHNVYHGKINTPRLEAEKNDDKKIIEMDEEEVTNKMKRIENEIETASVSSFIYTDEEEMNELGLSSLYFSDTNKSTKTNFGVTYHEEDDFEEDEDMYELNFSSELSSVNSSDSMEYGMFERYVEGGVSSPIHQMSEDEMDFFDIERFSQNYNTFYKDDNQVLVISPKNNELKTSTSDARNIVTNISVKDFEDECYETEIKTLIHLGDGMKKNGNLTGCISAYQRACFLNPNDSNLLNLLGSTLFEAKDYDEAILLLEKSISLKKSKDTCNLLSKIYQEIGDYKNAMNAYKKYLEDD